MDKREIVERVDKFVECEAFINVKDHKEEFATRVKHRLVNPAKTNVGIISQQILAKTNRTIRDITKLPQLIQYWLA